MPKLTIFAKPEKLPKSKRKARRVIAQDVVASLLADAITAQAGTYVYLEGSGGRDMMDASDGGAQLHDVLKKVKRCEACALGALFTCHVARFDAVTVGNYRDDEQFRVSLEKYFDVPQLALIETCFEGNISPQYFDFIPHHERHAHTAHGRAWKSTYPADADRMMAIMVNILKSPKGIFDPTDVMQKLPVPKKKS